MLENIKPAVDAVLGHEGNAGKIRIVGAVYDMDTGEIEFLD